METRSWRKVVRLVTPDRLRGWAWRRGYRAWPPVGTLGWGGLRRTTPVSRHVGFDRGQPIDRWYIERFLAAHSDDVRGRVLEFGDDTYAKRYGRQLERVDIADVDTDNDRAAFVADLNDPDALPAETYDCIVCTQVLLLVWDLPTAVDTLHRALRPGGVLLVTMPGIARVCRDDTGLWADYWRLTAASARRLFGTTFEAQSVEVASHGNVLAAVAQLHGIAATELDDDELATHDPDYEVVVTVRAQRR
jgi:SAM-dependent methyltransferase